MQKKNTIYALGFFDGVHLGHQALLKACRKLADTHGCQAGVVTFTTHPDGLVSGKAPVLLNTIEDRVNTLASYGMDVVATLPFDEELMQTHWSDFLTKLTDDGAAGFVCGSDFRFGSRGEGTAEKLAAFCESRNMPYCIVPQQILDGVRVSSSLIRELLGSGQLETANHFLGHPHFLTGKVITGRGLGRTIGVPTANLEIPEGILLPNNGVYACAACFGQEVYPAVTNIGTRPTVNGEHVTVEAWLLDFEGDLYGQELTLAFCRYLRPEKKFNSLEELKAEIEKNAAETRKIFENQ